MSKFIGRLVEIGIAKESPRGTFGGSISYWLKKTGMTFDNKSNLVKSGESAGNIAGVTTGLVTEQWAEGEIEGEINDKSFGLILLAAFGSESSAAFNGARKHTYSLLNTNEHPSLSIAQKDEDDDILFRRAMINSLTINVRLDEIVSFNANIMSHASEDYAAFTPDYVSENKFIPRHLSVKVASSPAGLDGASETRLKELTLNIEKNLTRDNVLGSVEAVDIQNTMFNISGTIVLTQENKTFRNNALNGAVKALRIDLVNSGRTIGTTNPAFRIDLDKVIFEEWEVDKTNDEIVTQTLNFTAYFSPVNNQIWSDCFLVNEVGSDY
ncbi:hypothetical protein LCGC14_0961350 [marine sediment metagenome]|uniref:Uncharacterized protein n=1 Tax=marine sediment metagenome TaxID=412755 RepID=A0A0F9QXK3_9ZZZZ